MEELASTRAARAAPGAGAAIPRIGLGTWSLTGAAGIEAILAALEIGYRHLDTAQSYGTETTVGKAIERSGLKRDEVFVTTKVTPENFSRFLPSLRESLDTLRLDRVDLTLIHWPAPRDRVPVSAYIGELIRAREAGLTRFVGVSNFTIRQIEAARAVLGEGVIATNQVECHVYLQNRILAAHCARAGIPITAYLPLAGGRTANDPVLRRISKKHSAEPTQIALAFLLGRGCIVIPKSADPARLRSNFLARDLTLDPVDMKSIEALDRGERQIDPEWGPKWD